ncbi:MAG: DUF3108 domain-containing protein [Gemmatimonadaceae bacterium]
MRVLGARHSTVAPGSDSVRCASEPSASIITDVAPRSTRPPFAAGERLEYRVSFGAMHVGLGRMVLVGHDTARGQPVLRASFVIAGGVWPLTVHDSMTSWFDSLAVASVRFTQDLHELRRHATKFYSIFPDRQTYAPRGEAERPTVPEPLDDVSFVYLARTLPLEPGQCYELRRYFKPDGNPVVIRVVKRESITVPAGTFNTILVRPEITTSAIFSKNGHAELWLSDDSLHVPVRLEVGLPFGSIKLYLSKIDRQSP